MASRLHTVPSWIGAGEVTDKTMLTTRDAAAFLVVSYRSLGENWYRWGLKAYRIGKRNMFRVSELEKYLQDHAITEPQRVA
jgi:hypothetical protein